MVADCSINRAKLGLKRGLPACRDLIVVAHADQDACNFVVDLAPEIRELRPRRNQCRMPVAICRAVIGLDARGLGVLGAEIGDNGDCRASFSVAGSAVCCIACTRSKRARASAVRVRPNASCCVRSSTCRLISLFPCVTSTMLWGLVRRNCFLGTPHALAHLIDAVSEPAGGPGCHVALARR